SRIDGAGGSGRSSRSSQLLLDVPLQHLQRHRAISQDPLVELADVEARTEALLRALAERHHAQTADLVGERLGRDVGGVAQCLGGDLRSEERRVGKVCRALVWAEAETKV